MFDTARHVPLRAVEWVPSEAQAAIDEVVADTLAQFNEARFWPAQALARLCSLRVSTSAIGKRALRNVGAGA